jgi:hypothetical protein
MNSEQYKAIDAAISSGCGAIGGLAGASLGGIPGSIAGATIGTGIGHIISQKTSQEIASFHLAKFLQKKLSSDFKNSFLLDYDIFDDEVEELRNRRVEAHHKNWNIKDVNLDNYLYFDRIESWNFKALSNLFDKILKEMDEGSHISLWEPLASKVRNNKEFEEIKMPGYKVVFHLFARDFWHSSEFTKERLAFQDLFQNEWRICKFNQERSLDLLKRDREYISNFAIGSGF